MPGISYKKRLETVVTTTVTISRKELEELLRKEVSAPKHGVIFETDKGDDLTDMIITWKEVNDGRE